MMEIFRNSQGIILKPGGLASEESCCCEIKCTETGAGSGGQGVTIDYYPFPLDRQEIFFTWQAYGIPDKFTVSACGTELFTTGEPVSGGGERCLIKPAGCDEIEIRVDGPDSGTAWNYGFACKCPPPPPPIPCCTLFTRCEDLNIFKCSGTERSCCRSLFPDSDCSGDDPPIIECDQSAAELATVPDQRPFDCLGRTDEYYRFGAFLEISGFSSYTATGTTPADFDAFNNALFSHLMSLMNDTYFAEWYGCFASADTTYSSAGPTLTDGTGAVYATQWEVRIILDMCERAVNVIVGEVGFGLASQSMAFLLGARETITAECNDYTGCYCSSFTGTALVGGVENGIITVGF